MKIKGHTYCALTDTLHSNPHTAFHLPDQRQDFGNICLDFVVAVQIYLKDTSVLRVPIAQLNGANDTLGSLIHNAPTHEITMLTRPDPGLNCLHHPVNRGVMKIIAVAVIAVEKRHSHVIRIHFQQILAITNQVVPWFPSSSKLSAHFTTSKPHSRSRSQTAAGS